MKRNPFYRRKGTPGKHDGVKERFIWQLSKRPMTGSELSQILKVPRNELNKLAGEYLKQTGVATIEASEWFQAEDGLKDRVYTLVKVGKKAYPTAGKSIIFSENSRKIALAGERDEKRELAKRRARLIKSGLYINELG